MIFYKATAILNKPLQPDFSSNVLTEPNTKLQRITDPLDFMVRMTNKEDNKAEFIVLLKTHTLTKGVLHKALIRIIGYLEKGVQVQSLTMQEISLTELYQHIDEGARKVFYPCKAFDVIKRMLPEVSRDFFGEEITVETVDRLFPFTKGMDVRKCRNQVKADASFDEELRRIYHPDHPKQFYGMPVHYKIRATSMETAHEILDGLLQALYANRRIVSRRVTTVKVDGEEYDDTKNLERYFKLGNGGCVAIELNQGQDEPEFMPFNMRRNGVKNFASLVKAYATETLIVFLETSKPTAFSKKLFQQLGESLEFVELREGLNGTMARDYFRKLAKDAQMESYLTEIPDFEEELYHSVEEIQKRFETCRQNSLKGTIYSAYGTSASLVPSAAKGTAYQELQRMIGLNTVKDIISDIVSVEKMNQLRTKMGAGRNTLSKHMVFFGNPGTAKTTVARLAAEIMRDEGLLETGKFVECGRADLVGQYVGWTAKQVREKFQEAKGGVLFIDEAYSLVEDHHSYGDEAINTIVAEMENLRDEVVVIFAGYPQKMREFLARNEGLQSRITYHVDFPDYTPEDLMQILYKHAEDRGFTLTKDAETKCKNIFAQVYQEPDYGNGRFVRNLLEQGILHQASRLGKTGEAVLSREMLFTLTGEDFVQREVVREKKKALIGFTA